MQFYNHSLQESQRRWLAAIKSIDLGYGGTSKVSRATRLSRTTVTQGIKELKGDKPLSSDRATLEVVGTIKIKIN